jgi:hypothetical protein
LSFSSDIAGRVKHVALILDIEFPRFIDEFLDLERRRLQGAPLSGLDEWQLSNLNDRLNLLRQIFLSGWRRLTEYSRGLIHADLIPENCGYDDNDELTIVSDFESVGLGALPPFGAKAIGALCISHKTAVQEVVAAMQVMVNELRNCSPALGSPPA